MGRAAWPSLMSRARAAAPVARGVGGGVPADAGEGEVADDEGGVVVGGDMVDGRCGRGAMVRGLRASAACSGGGVAAALGGEVAAEAEHVRPAAEPAEGVESVFVLLGVEERGWAEGQGVGDEPAEVGVGVGVVVGGLDGDPPGEEAGGLGGLGGVLGQVGGDGLGDLACRGRGGRAVERLRAPVNGPRRPGCRGSPASGSGGATAAATRPEVASDLGRWGRIARVGGVDEVEAEQGVEVHDAAGL